MWWRLNVIYDFDYYYSPCSIKYNIFDLCNMFFEDILLVSILLTKPTETVGHWGGIFNI